MVYVMPTNDAFEVHHPIKTSHKESAFTKECREFLEQNDIRVYNNDKGEPIVKVEPKVCRQ